MTEHFGNFDVNQFAGHVNANIPSVGDRRQQWNGPSGLGRKDDITKERLQERGAYAETKPIKISASINVEAVAGKKPSKAEHKKNGAK